MKSISEVKMFYGGMVPGSWEYIGNKLREQAKPYLMGKDVSLGDHDWVYLAGTFPTYAVMGIEKSSGGQGRFYKADWEIDNGEPNYKGDPEEVRIEVSAEIRKKMMDYMTLEKAGKVLSQRNYNSIKEVAEDMDEIHEGCATKGHRALCKQSQAKLVDVLKTAKPVEDEPKQAEVTIKQAMALVLEATVDDRQQMLKMLHAIEVIEQREQQTKSYRDLVGST